MSGTDGTSVDNVRPDAVTLSLKVTFNLCKGSCVDVSKNIFSNNVKRSVSLDLSQCPGPHAVAIPLCVGSAVALAWVAACDDIAGAVEVACAHVVVDRHVGPMLSQDGLAERLALAEGNGAKSSCCLKSEAEPSDPAEQVEDGEVFF